MTAPELHGLTGALFCCQDNSAKRAGIEAQQSTVNNPAPGLRMRSGRSHKAGSEAAGKEATPTKPAGGRTTQTQTQGGTGGRSSRCGLAKSAAQGCWGTRLVTCVEPAALALPCKPPPGAVSTTFGTPGLPVGSMRVQKESPEVSAPSKRSFLSRLPCRPGSSRGSRDAGALPAAGAAAETWVTALRLLSDYLIDEDVAVIRSAQYTLRYAAGAGAGALHALCSCGRPPMHYGGSALDHSMRGLCT